MARKCTKSTAKANVASKRSCRVSDLETKLKGLRTRKMENQLWLLLASQVCPIPPQLQSWRTITKWWSQLKDLLHWKQRH